MTMTTYRSICGKESRPCIDCDRHIRTLYARIHHYLQKDQRNCPICDYFREKIGSRDGSESDARLLLHAQVSVIHELFARHGDQQALALLEQAEGRLLLKPPVAKPACSSRWMPIFSAPITWPGGKPPL